MGVLGGFFAKNKIVVLVVAAIVAIQGLTMTIGLVAGAASFMQALDGNKADANKCTGNYKDVVSGIFGSNPDALAELLTACPIDKQDSSYDVSLWLQIIQEAQAKLGTGYDDAKVNALEALAEEAANGGTNYDAGGGGSYLQPVNGPLYDGFGPRAQVPGAGAVTSSFHRGQDIGEPVGTPVRAAHDGKVTYAGLYGTYGNWVLINTGGGVDIGTAHESKILVKVGDVVKKGQVIALSGGAAGAYGSGASSGPHVHVEAHINGTAVDPVPFFKSHGAPLGPNGGSTGGITGGAGALTTNADVEADFTKMKQEHHDGTIWQAIIDYATAKINGTSYNEEVASDIVDAAEAHVGDKYVASRSGWNNKSQNYCAKSPKSVGGDEVKQCGFDDASLIGYAISKGQDLKIDPDDGLSVKPWNQSVAAEENYLTNDKHGVVVNLTTIMPGDLVFTSYSSDLDNPDLVVLYVGTEVHDGTKMKHWIEALDDDTDIIDVWSDNPDFISSYTYEVVRPYHAAVAEEYAPVTGKGAIADAKRYAQQEIDSHHDDWGWSVSADWDSLEKMWTKESSWNLTAENDACHTASPAAPEYQAYGIPQMCPGSNMANKLTGGGPDWKTNYKTQIDAGLYYIHNRYKSPHHAWAVWQTQGWY